MTAALDENSPLLAQDQHTRYNSNGIEPSHVEQQQTEEPKKLKSYAIYLLPMTLGIFLRALDGAMIVSSYAAIGSDLKELQKMSWIPTSYLLVLTSFQPLYGKLSDIFGRKSSLLFAYAVFTVGCALCGSARTMNGLIMSRAFQGIGGAGMQTIVAIIMSDVVPLRFRGTWQGIINVIFSSGNAAGASLGGYLVDTVGWRWVFYSHVPPGVIAALSVYFFLNLPSPSKASSPDTNFKTKLRRVDFAGATTLVLAVFLLLLALHRGGNIGWNDKLTVSFLVGFAIFAIAFGFTEARFAAEPLAPPRIIVNRSLLASYLVNFFGMAATATEVFHISLYMQAVLAKTASETGAWLVVGSVATLTGSLGCGIIMQSTGKYYTLTCVAYVVLLLGTLTELSGTGFMGLPRTTAQIIVGLALTTLGIGCGTTSTLISLIAKAGKDDHAIAIAVSYLFRSLGSVIGLSIGSTLLQSTLRSVLHRTLKGDNVEEIVQRVRKSLHYLSELDPETRAIVRAAYGDAVQNTLIFSVTMAVAAVVCSFFIVEKSLQR